MIDSGDKPPALLWPVPPNPDEPMFGPELIRFRQVIPADLCASVRSRYSPEVTNGGERYYVNPGCEPELSELAGLVAAVVGRDHYGGAGATVDHAFVIRFRRGQKMRHHADNEYEGVVLPGASKPTGRASFALCGYLSDPGDYDGGALVVDGYDPIRPELGEVIAIRGDVGHAVTTITRGDRFLLKWVTSLPAARAWRWSGGGWVPG